MYFNNYESFIKLQANISLFKDHEHLLFKVELRGELDGKTFYQIVFHQEEELRSCDHQTKPAKTVVKDTAKDTYKIAKGTFDLENAVFVDHTGKKIEAHRVEELDEHEFIELTDTVGRSMLEALDKAAKERQEAANAHRPLTPSQRPVHATPKQAFSFPLTPAFIKSLISAITSKVFIEEGRKRREAERELEAQQDRHFTKIHEAHQWDLRHDQWKIDVQGRVLQKTQLTLGKLQNEVLESQHLLSD